MGGRRQVARGRSIRDSLRVSSENGELEHAFRAGFHQRVLDRLWDGPEATHSIEDAPLIAGSLALLGRLDEALALVKELAADPAVPTAIAVESRFFLVVGFCHAGLYADAATWAGHNAAHARAREPRTRFFVFQGIALLRYFTGRLAKARLSSKRALKEAVVARFQYGRLLALDLWGHILVQRGEVHAGLRTLQQAMRFADAIGSTGHRMSIECARLAYENRHGRKDDELESSLARITASAIDNLYAHRSAWLELAFRGALLGDAERAREALDRAAEHAIAEADFRARTWYFLTQAFVSRLDRSHEDVRLAIEDAARALAKGEDQILYAELLARDAVLGSRSVDHARITHLARTTGSLVSRALIAISSGVPLDSSDANESPLWALLASRDEPLVRIERAIGRGWLGLLPIISETEPGRHLFFVRDQLIVDNHGMLQRVDQLPGHARELLLLLHTAERTKEELVREVWRVPRYAPNLHDAVVHTAIARLRRALGPNGDWVETTTRGYVLRGDVVLVMPNEHVPRSVPPESSAADKLSSRIESILTRGPTSASDIAEALRVSQATVLRRLREMQAQNLVTREGAGKRTRYLRSDA
jgi:DNA-binding winged helix-turn-helix (wHTH) protein/tetratricopeptide (TPR) repeat protein